MITSSDIETIIDVIFADVQLLPAQKKVVLAFIECNTNQEIADKMQWALPTVKFYLWRIYGKFGVGSRLGLFKAIQERFESHQRAPKTRSIDDINQMTIDLTD
jgi:DNA-binding NarL/FixJ family response regulator